VLLGECTLTLRELLESEGSKIKSFPLTIPPRFNVTAPEDSKLTVIKASLISLPTLFDYIAGKYGTQMYLVVAIDFTESNGDPKTPSSLHYIGDENNENDYQRSVGEMYDNSQKF